MGTITVASGKKLTTFGSRKVCYGTLSPSASYATNGELWTEDLFKLNKLDRLFVFPAGGYSAEPDMTNKKVIIKGQNPTSTSSGIVALEEIANTTDLSAVAFPFMAIGH